MRLRVTVIALGFGALACGGGSTPADSDAPGGRPGGGGGSVDTADSGADTSGGGGGWGSPCPRYSGMKEGARWTWRYTDAYAAEVGSDATWSQEVVSIDGDLVVLAYEGEIEHESFDAYRYEGETRYRCDDGLFALSSETRTDYSIQGTAYWSESSNRYDGEGWLLLPADPGPGESWSALVTGTSTTTTSQSGTSSQDFTWSWDYRIEDGGDVDTPAGPFRDTLEVFSENDDGVSSWFNDEHAGTVVQAGDHAELVSWSD